MRGLKQITARRQSWRSIGRCERGATAIEYALILSLVFLAIIGAVANVADKTIGMWNHVEAEVTAH